MTLDRAGRLRVALERDGATCVWCGPVDWLEECLRRGWEPDQPRLARSLALLGAAIARRGGQRRARPYLDAQLRRLRRRGPAAPVA